MRPMSATIPILTFHRLDLSGAVIAFSPDVFAVGMARLCQRGYRAISLAEAARALAFRQPFPDRSIVITFDDGFESVYTTAFPVLQRLGLTATVFLVAGNAKAIPLFAGWPRLSEDQVREMSHHGIAFGAHTMNHPDLTVLPPDRVEAEMRESKEKIEQMLGQTVSSFAYPYGASNRVSRDIARRHFEYACTASLGLVSGKSDLLRLERVDGYYLRDPRLFALLTSPVFSNYVRARNIPRRLRHAFLGLKT